VIEETSTENPTSGDPTDQVPVKKRTCRRSHVERKRKAQADAGRITARDKKLKSLTNQVYNREQKLKELDSKIAEKEDIVEQMKLAPSPTKQRQILFAKFAEYDFDPIDQMIEYAMDGKIPIKERITITKELAGLAYAKPKSIDVQGSMSSEVHVHVLDFKNVTQKSLGDHRHPDANALIRQTTNEILDAELAEDAESGDDVYSEFTAPEDL